MSEAARVAALRGPLADEDLAWLEGLAPLLRVDQLRGLAAHTDALTRSPSLAALHHSALELERRSASAWQFPHDDFLREQLPAWLEARSVGAQALARSWAILLSGLVSEADQALVQASGRGLVERPLVLRAALFDLLGIERRLALRWIEVVGVETLADWLGLPAAPSGPDAICDALDQGQGLDRLFEVRRDPPPRPVEPDPRTWEGALAELAVALGEADAGAARLGRQPSNDAVRAAAEAYVPVVEHLRTLLARDPRALREPLVKTWLQRRGRALLLRQAEEELEGGPCLAGERPGGEEVLAEEVLRIALAERLGVDAAGLLLDRRALREGLAAELFVDPAWEPALVALPPQLARTTLERVGLVYAQGVVRHDGILHDSLAWLERRWGLAVELAEGGSFQGEGHNGRELRRALERAAARVPGPLILVGYSQGSAVALHLLDRLRCGEPADKALAARVRGVLSLYGAHNGSHLADLLVDEGLELAEGLGGQALVDLVLGTRRLGRRLLAGGMDSLRPATRARFWRHSALPEDIPYLSLGAVCEPEDLPLPLQPLAALLAGRLEVLGLGGAHDSQVLAADAPLGSPVSANGRAVRDQDTHFELRGHHWNPLRGRHAGLPGARAFRFPKSPQVAMPVALLGESGLLG